MLLFQHNNNSKPTSYFVKFQLLYYVAKQLHTSSQSSNFHQFVQSKMMRNFTAAKTTLKDASFKIWSWITLVETGYMIRLPPIELQHSQKTTRRTNLSRTGLTKTHRLCTKLCERYQMNFCTQCKFLPIDRL